MNYYRACAPVKTAQKSTHYLLPMFSTVLFAVVIGGCSDSVKIPASNTVGPRLYMSSTIYGGSYPGASTGKVATYSIDHTATPPSFAQKTYAFSDTQSGAQVNYSGNVASSGLARGLEQLELIYACAVDSTAGCTNFTLSNSGPINVAAGATSGNTATITVTPSNSFTGAVSLSCAVTNSPSAASSPVACNLSPSSVTISGSTAQTARLTASTTSTTTTGIYGVTVTGTSGSALITTTVCVAVGTSAGGCTSTGDGWAMELAGQSGGLLQLTGQPFVPLVPAVTCPSMKSAEPFLFVTLPSRLLTSGTASNAWNPGVETAYGSVEISGNGSKVTLDKIKQYTLNGGSPNAYDSSATGACSQTVYGNTVAVPPNPTVASSGQGSPQVVIGIGPSGLLVESGSQPNVLGAGTGAIGLPKPSSAINMSSLIGAQYLGFFWGTGFYSTQVPQWSSSVASFGFPSVPSTCPSPAKTLANPLYGGDFAGNNPAAAQVNGGFGNCDVIIDLGVPDPSPNDGIFSGATVYVYSGFGNKTFKSYAFPAIAIAGQLGGKFAIFLIGEDTTGSPNQAWGIYLLQSN